MSQVGEEGCHNDDRILPRRGILRDGVELSTGLCVSVMWKSLRVYMIPWACARLEMDALAVDGIWEGEGPLVAETMPTVMMNHHHSFSTMPTFSFNDLRDRE